MHPISLPELTNRLCLPTIATSIKQRQQHRELDDPNYVPQQAFPKLKTRREQMKERDEDSEPNMEDAKALEPIGKIIDELMNAQIQTTKREKDLAKKRMSYASWRKKKKGTKTDEDRLIEILSMNYHDRTHDQIRRAFKILRKIQAFLKLPDFLLYQLGRVIAVVQYPKDHIVFKQGEHGTSWYVVLEGSVDVLSKNIAAIALSDIQEKEDPTAAELRSESKYLVTIGNPSHKFNGHLSILI